MRLRNLIWMLVVLSLVLAACGGSDSGDDNGTTTTEEETTTTEPETTTTTEEETTTTEPETTTTTEGTTTPPSETTAVVGGVEYTCEEMVGEVLVDPNDCRGYQEDFDTWGDNIDAFVSSGELGYFDTRAVSLADIVTVGFDACSYWAAGQSRSDFVEVQANYYPDLVLADYIPVWKAAVRHLCEDAFCVQTDGDLEGCFDFDDMDVLLDLGAIPLVDQFLDDTYEDMPRPDSIWYARQGEAFETPCGNGNGGPALLTDTSYFYCPADNSINIGLVRLWRFYTEQGDAGAIAGYAHEMGHHVQNMVEITAIVDTQAEQISQENQADCFAGAFIGWTEEQGLLDYSDDEADLVKLVEAIASAEGPNRTHGTIAERADAVLLGWNGGMFACNEFFPDRRIIN